MREAWTDGRLDDLNRRVDSGFEEVGREFQTLRLEMRTEFVAVRGEMAAMNQTLIQVGAGFMVTMFVGFGATIATVLTQT